MTTPNKPLHFLSSVARTLLGLVFVFSGFVKAIDPLGTLYKVEDYLAALGSADFLSAVSGLFSLLTPLALPIALLLIAVEFTLGVMLLTNTWTKVTSWLTLAFMLLMTPLTLWLALTGAVADCGCFGDALILTNWQTFWKNVVLLVLVIVLLCTKRFVPRTFLWPVELAVTLLSVGFVFGWMTFTILHLPVKDFRPYKIGNNIPELMEVPEDAPVDVYEVRFIYEKDGHEEEFTLENYPKNDSTWTFVDQKSVLISKGYEAPIHDFVVFNEEMEDITYDLFEGEVTLAICYKLERANKKQLMRLAQMADEAAWNAKPFYLLTGSGEEEIETFRQQAGYAAEIFFCDPTALKTVVRANPGIVCLEDGVVVDKYNLRNR